MSQTTDPTPAPELRPPQVGAAQRVGAIVLACGSPWLLWWALDAWRRAGLPEGAALLLALLFGAVVGALISGLLRVWDFFWWFVVVAAWVLWQRERRDGLQFHHVVLAAGVLAAAAAGWIGEMVAVELSRARRKRRRPSEDDLVPLRDRALEEEADDRPGNPAKEEVP
jgi:hypothetical protein